MTRYTPFDCKGSFSAIPEGLNRLRLTPEEWAWAMPPEAARAAGASAPEPASRLGLSAASLSQGGC